MRSFRCWCNRLFSNDLLSFFVIAGFWRLGSDLGWVSELIGDLPIQCCPVADRVDVTRNAVVRCESSNRGLWVCAIRGVTEVEFRTHVVKRQASSEGVNREKSLRIENTGQHFPIRRGPVGCIRIVEDANEKGTVRVHALNRLRSDPVKIGSVETQFKLAPVVFLGVVTESKLNPFATKIA